MKIAKTLGAAVLAVFLITDAPLARDAAAPAVSSGEVVVIEDFGSSYVPARNILVWLPEGYSEETRYAVLYMHDGDMLFDASTTWNGQEWGVDEAAARLMDEGDVRDFIVVGIPNAGPGRHAEYFPQKPFEMMTAQQQERFYAMGREHGAVFDGEVRSDAYLRFLVEELKPYIDSNYAVHADSDNTFVMGSSMGGLISIYALARYPDVFGGAACLSTHWPGVMPHSDNPWPLQMQRFLAGALAGGKKVWFDHGTEDLDSSYPELQKQVDVVMREKGYGPNNWVTYVDEGANHSEDAWRARLHMPLEFLLAPPKDTSLAKVASPDGRIVFELHEGRFGSKTYTVRYGEEAIVKDAQLGMRFVEQAGFDRNLNWSARFATATTGPGSSPGVSGG